MGVRADQAGVAAVVLTGHRPLKVTSGRVVELLDTVRDVTKDLPHPPVAGSIGPGAEAPRQGGDHHHRCDEV